MESASASPDLSSNNKKKVCVIVGINAEPSIFLVDLDFKYGVDANGFAEMKPNFRVVGLPGIANFCVVDATLFMLHFEVDCLRSVVPELYCIDLQAASKMSDCRLGLGRTQLTRCPDRLPKVLPQFVDYRGKLLIFSTEIPYEIEGDVDGGNDDAIDFELYDPNSQKPPTALPRLIVCRNEDENIFRLFNADKQCHYDVFPACRRRTWDDSHFSIVASVVDEDRFIIETDFGRMFSLNLKVYQGGTGSGSDDYRWRLCEEGYEIGHMPNKNIVRGGICFSDDSINDSPRIWLQQLRKYDQDHGDGRKRAKMGYGDVRSIRIPPVEIDMYGLQYGAGLQQSSFDLLQWDPYMLLCTAQQVFDKYEYSHGDCFFERLFMVLNVLRVNLEKFPSNYQDDSVDKFLKHVTSIKFFVSERNCAPAPHVMGLFYY